MDKMVDFYRGKRVFITGHTGFKGTWLCHILSEMGAEVTGFALNPPTDPSAFEITGAGERVTSFIGDIRSLPELEKAFAESKPDIVIHMAAQPIVRESYKNPHCTYETNVMGTVNILECVRHFPVKSFLNVTTDKVYKNNEWCWGYRENEPLDGFDPYSNSKSCSELVTHSYRDSFLSAAGVAVSTARAGNVIGGGDFAADRIIPDCVRAALSGREIILRNPYSVRPFQHVLEPLRAYLMLAAAQYDNADMAGSYNVGPDESDCITTGELTDIFCRFWGEGAHWRSEAEKNAPHEANFLKLDCSLLKSALDWKPITDITEAVRMTVEWTKAYRDGENMKAVTARQIHEFFGF